MIVKQIIQPASILVVGGSGDVTKPGGKVIQNLLQQGYAGNIHVVNAKATQVQSLPCFSSVEQAPPCELAILAVPARFCYDIVRVLCRDKHTRGFIIFSAGFSEMGEAGATLEQQIVDEVNDHGGTLIGPNCIGVRNQYYAGVFTEPIPEFSATGCDLASSSGAVAVALLEMALHRGIRFNSYYSVGNGKQTGIEDLLAYWDQAYTPDHSARLKLLYIENIKDPARLVQHARSLVSKGCYVLAIKSGISEAGRRAASSHTGAIVTSDTAVDAMFRKAGIIRCSGREEMINVATVLSYPERKGKNLAVITHAGGAGVLMADALANNGLNVPEISGPPASELLAGLHHGSSVANPIDFLATGTHEQLGRIIDFCDNCDIIDAMAVIFGSPGLVPVADAYRVMLEKIDSCTKPVYPILPSMVNAALDIQLFVEAGRPFFTEEVLFAGALGKVVNHKLFDEGSMEAQPDVVSIRALIDSQDPGYMSAGKVGELLDAIGVLKNAVYDVIEEQDIHQLADQLDFPWVMKVKGILHKSDVGGVLTNITSPQQAVNGYRRLMQIQHVTGVTIEQTVEGQELMIGIKKEDPFGHVLVVGFGGVLVEVDADIRACLCPLSRAEARDVLHNLRKHVLLAGYRNLPPISEKAIVDCVMRISTLVGLAPEITEMDINPLIGNRDQLVAVDARIYIDN